MCTAWQAKRWGKESTARHCTCIALCEAQTAQRCHVGIWLAAAIYAAETAMRAVLAEKTLHTAQR